MKRAVRTPFFFRFFNPENLVSRMPDDEKAVYLTFDDGPVPEVTPEVLRILADRHVGATFFMVGDNIRKHPDIYEQVVAAGHAVGNHTFHHLNGWKIAPAAYVEDVMRVRTYSDTHLFRPPYGRFTPSQYLILKKDFRFVVWSLLTWDFSPHVTPEQCLEMAIRNTRPGEIVVFHDSLKAQRNLLYALPRYLDEFRARGYVFKLLETKK
ncbi:MAG TPA: polysaccharide deacetylase family protein [Bacteroidales bacterium]|nr:polysaccharide deacetylase family protein [Bacteroidales bacterium]HPS73835.1 polysaccharide deacetylase family protein [Bacteroidales bacterium]